MDGEVVLGRDERQRARGARRGSAAPPSSRVRPLRRPPRRRAGGCRRGAGGVASAQGPPRGRRCHPGPVADRVRGNYGRAARRPMVPARPARADRAMPRRSHGRVSSAARDSREPSTPTPIVLASRGARAVPARCDEDRARRAVQRARGHVARQHAPDAPAVGRADHDEVGVVACGGVVQGATGRAVGDHERARGHPGPLDLVPGQLPRAILDDLLVLAVGAAAEVVRRGGRRAPR